MPLRALTAAASPSPTVHVTPLWGPGPREEQRARAEAHLVEELGLERVARLCGRCASSRHGRPVPLGGAGRVHLGLAYADGVVLAAWSTAPLGVDVEREAPGRDAGDYGDLRAWTRLEAVAKTTGEGLAREPSELPDLWTAPLPLPDGWVGSVACAEPAGLSWRPGAPAAPAR